MSNDSDPTVSISVSTDDPPPTLPAPVVSPPADPPPAPTLAALSADFEAKESVSLAAAAKAQDLAKQASEAQDASVAAHASFIDARKALEAFIEAAAG